jgi:hypothetical protein
VLNAPIKKKKHRIHIYIYCNIYYIVIYIYGFYGDYVGDYIGLYGDSPSTSLHNDMGIFPYHAVSSMADHRNGKSSEKEQR